MHEILILNGWYREGCNVFKFRAFQMDFLSRAYRASFSGTKSQDQGSFGSTFNKEYTPVRSAIESVTYIADHLKNEQDDSQVGTYLFEMPCVQY